MELSNDYGTPTTILQALKGPDADLWKQSAIAEINNFLKRGSWKFVKKSDVLKQGRKPIGTKWVFKIKHESDNSLRYKSRVVTKGYQQIPGVDYTEKFSPVATASSLRTGLGLTLYNDNWISELVDVEAAFLEGKLKTSTYIDLPKGMVELGFLTPQEFQETCIELLGGMYGNVDAALLYFTRFTTYATSKEGLNLTQSESDPCVFYKKGANKKDSVILIVYVDDCMICGTQKAVNEIKQKMKTEFGIVEDGQLKKLLGVRYDWKKTTKGERYVVMSMEDKAKEIIKSYEEFTGKSPKVQNTPGTPGTVLTKNEGEPINLDEYRSLIGKLLFYGTKIGPDCAFANGQLARHMQNPGEQHWKAMERMIGYLKGKKNHELIIRKPQSLRIISYGDSSYGDCKDTRRSSSGDFHTLGGALVSWRSQRLRMVCLSSTEAEYVTMTEMAKEQRFLQMLIEELTGTKDTGIIYGDNEAAVYLSKNKHVSARTKHIDIKSHYIRDHVEEGRAIIKGERTENNFSDILTKNTTVATFKKLSEAILNGFKGWDNKFEWINEINKEKNKESKIYQVNMMRLNQTSNNNKRHKSNNKDNYNKRYKSVCEKNQRENVKNYFPTKTIKQETHENNEQNKRINSNNERWRQETKNNCKNINAHINVHPNTREKQCNHACAKSRYSKNYRNNKCNENGDCMLKCQQQIREFCSLHTHARKTDGKTVTKSNKLDKKADAFDTLKINMDRKMNTKADSKMLNEEKTHLYKNEVSQVDVFKTEEGKILRSIKVELGRKPTFFSINWNKVVDEDIKVEYKKESMFIKINLD
jgi:hypothetical protein